MGDHVHHLRGHQDHILIFFVTFNITLICYLSGQEAFFVESLTIWNTEPPCLKLFGVPYQFLALYKKVKKVAKLR